jgi:hypothetical protein
MDLGEVGCDDVNWIGMGNYGDKWRVLVNAEINLRVSYNAGNSSSGYTPGGLSSSAQVHRVSVTTLMLRLNCMKETCHVCCHSRHFYAHRRIFLWGQNRRRALLTNSIRYRSQQSVGIHPHVLIYFYEVALISEFHSFSQSAQLF